jgi:hypothetical protein
MRHATRLSLLVVALSLLVSFASGCATLSDRGALDMATPVAQSESGRWESVVREHTRKVEVFEWAVRWVDLRATLVTPRLRTAFIAAEPRLHGRVAHEFKNDLLRLGAPPDEGVDSPILSRPHAEEEVIIYVCFYVADQKHRDLGAGYTIWDTTLVRGDAKVVPTAIETLKYSPALEALLPHADRFDEIYVMRFPLVDAATGTAMLSPGGEPLRLEIRSALADAVVSWTLEAP